MQLIRPIRNSFFKVILVTLTVNYLLFSVGVVKATHFCMGREASVKFFSSEAEKCFCGKFLTEKSGCCDDQQEVIRIEDDHKAFTSLILTEPLLPLFEIFNFNDILVSHQWNEWIRNSHNSIEKSPPIPLYKAYCSLVFYDDNVIS